MAKYGARGVEVKGFHWLMARRAITAVIRLVCMGSPLTFRLPVFLFVFNPEKNNHYNHGGSRRCGS